MYTFSPKGCTNVCIWVRGEQRDRNTSSGLLDKLFQENLKFFFFFFKSDGDFISVQDLKFCYSGKSNRHSLIKKFEAKTFL